MMEREIIIPEVGMGATIGYGSDCYPHTIIHISRSGKRILLQEDNARRTDNNGYGGQQEWEISCNPSGNIYEASLRKNGRWCLKGSKQSIAIGHRSRYDDPHV